MKKRMSKCYLMLDTRRALKDGTYPVKVAVSYGTDLYIPTGIYTVQEKWDKENERIDGDRPGNAKISACLDRVSGRVLRLRSDGRFQKLKVQDLRKLLTALDMDSVTLGPSFAEVARRHVATKDRQATIDSYNLTIKKVEDYSPGVKIEEMSKEWLAGFCKHVGGKVNTQGVHLRNIRAVCNFAIDEELTTFYPFRKFKIKHEATRKKALSVEQVRQLAALELTAFQEEYRDLFLLMLYLRGINIGDLLFLTKENVVNGRLEYRRRKTGAIFSVKIEPEAAAIIERHAGEKYLVSPMDRYKEMKDYMHRINYGLRKLGVSDDISTNWARHTWATLCSACDIPKEIVSRGMGHSYGLAVTDIYIDFDMKKVDEANRRVIDHILYYK